MFGEGGLVLYPLLAVAAIAVATLGITRTDGPRDGLSTLLLWALLLGAGYSIWLLVDRI